MPMVKEGAAPDPAAVTPEPAVQEEQVMESTYKRRDYDAEARGKTACSTWNAAVTSPGLTLFPAKTEEEYLARVRRFADAGFNYAFEKQDGGK